MIMARAEPEHDTGVALPERLKAFGADRAAMMGAARTAGPADLKVQLLTYLDRLEHMLADGRPFLLGALVSIADFSAAQSIWFIRMAPPVAVLLEPYRKVVAWYERIEAGGHGSSQRMTSGEALQVAQASTDRYAPTEFDVTQGFAAGDEVLVTPTDYAHDPVAGRLVGLDAGEVVVERQDARAGTVHVHFPRVGFQIRKPPTA